MFLIKLEKLRAERLVWVNHMKRSAMSNDSYHITGQWQRDHDHLAELNTTIKRMEGTK